MDTATIGHNLPPTDAEILNEKLNENENDLLMRRDDLLAALGRMPEKIENEETAENAADYVKQISAAIKNSEARRVDAKEPYLEGSRIVDGFFKKVSLPLADLKAMVLKRITVYQQAKEKEEREERERIAKEAREEEERARIAAEEAAAAAQDDASLSEAMEAETTAEQAANETAKAEKEAAVKAADLSRTRSDLGAVSSLRTEWTFEITNIADIPLELLRQHIHDTAIEKAIRSYVKASVRELEGVRIFEETKATVR